MPSVCQTSVFGCVKLIEGLVFCNDLVRQPELKLDLEKVATEFSVLMNATYSTAGQTCAKFSG